MGSEAYGQLWASAILYAYPAVGQFLTRALVVFECTFPLILVAPPSVAIAMLLAGALFHLGCAVTMGLNAFLLVFPARTSASYTSHSACPPSGSSVAAAIVSWLAPPCGWSR